MDFLIVMLNRRNNYIEGESFYQTLLRLREPFQNWAQCQCDDGRAFQAAKAHPQHKVEEPEHSQEVGEVLAAKWSGWSYFCDQRLVVIGVMWPPVVILGNVFVNLYSKCGFWEHNDLDMCA